MSEQETETDVCTQVYEDMEVLLPVCKGPDETELSNCNTIPGDVRQGEALVNGEISVRLGFLWRISGFWRRTKG